MPLDKGTTGRDPEEGSAYARRRRRGEKDDRAKKRRPRPVRGEDPTSKARAPRSRRVRFEQERNQEIERQYGTGNITGNREAPGLVAGLLGPLAEGAAWAVTHPRQRLTGDIPDRFIDRDPATGFQISSGEFPWGMPGRFFRARRAKLPEPPPAVPVAGAERLIESLPEAKKLRTQQELLYSKERASRVAEADALANAIGGVEGHRAALEALKGELPKLRFGGLEGAFDETMVTNLFKHVNEHPELRKFERVRTRSALLDVLKGKVPTKSEIRLFEKAFGPETAAELQASTGFWRKAYNTGLEVINVPRALKSSMDISAPFRQALVLGARHPAMWSREWGPMLRAFRSEGAYEDIMDRIANSPNFGRYQTGRLAITDLGQIGTREEAFASNLAEHFPGVRPSGRAYTGFLNKFRADAFDHYIDLAAKQGHDIDDPELLKAIASWVNHGTGRGSLKNFEAAMKPLNAIFFSPRLMASRLQLLNPAYYAKLHPFARRQAIQGMARLLGGISLTLYMAKLGGADVGLDPRSADFGKIKIGNTRIDIAGGFQQYIVAATRLVKGETVSSTTGEVVGLEGGFANQSRADIAQRFLEQKFAPVPAYAHGFLKNENFEGQPFDPKVETARLFLPLGWEATYDTARQEGAGPAAATAVLGNVGFGVQTYGPQPPEPATRDSDGSPYARRRVGGGSPYARKARSGGSRYANG